MFNFFNESIYKLYNMENQPRLNLTSIVHQQLFSIPILKKHNGKIHYTLHKQNSKTLQNKKSFLTLDKLDNKKKNKY